MWNADPSGKFKFSDASVSTQLTLIAQQPDFDLLKRLIVDHFAGQDVSMAQLEEFVLVETLSGTSLQNTDTQADGAGW